jgi:hypothetical protein
MEVDLTNYMEIPVNLALTTTWSRAFSCSLRLIRLTESKPKAGKRDLVLSCDVDSWRKVDCVVANLFWLNRWINQAIQPASPRGISERSSRRHTETFA